MVNLNYRTKGDYVMENTLGKRISDLRKQKGLKQDELAEKLGISPQAVSKWENDLTCPDISLLPELAKILGVSIDELLTGKRENEQKTKILPPEERKSIDEMMLKVVIDSSEGDHVRINLPVILAKIALDSGMNIAEFSGNSSLSSIDLAKIMELIKQGVIGNLIEVESADGSTVRVFVE